MLRDPSPGLINLYFHVIEMDNIFNDLGFGSGFGFLNDILSDNVIEKTEELDIDQCIDFDSDDLYGLLGMDVDTFLADHTNYNEDE